MACTAIRAVTRAVPTSQMASPGRYITASEQSLCPPCRTDAAVITDSLVLYKAFLCGVRPYAEDLSGRNSELAYELSEAGLSEREVRKRNSIKII